MLKNVNLAHTDMSSKFPSVPCVQCSCRNMVGVMFSDLTVKKLFFYILRLDDFALTAKLKSGYLIFFLQAHNYISYSKPRMNRMLLNNSHLPF